ncbi:DUF6126 family protein [Streptomyces sulphureus]|uniref:DUF6126 family protein n=1 Tax=Streptomyces sulphureus TaxID=47758 RepID=UPI00037EECF3|nr:DUF6126 family protein [Streptomyces sulphureus]
MPDDDPRPEEESGDPQRDVRTPFGLKLRLFAYLVAGHLFAGFLYLLFYLGGTNE